MGRFLIFVSLALALYFALVLFLYFFQRSLLYHPSAGSPEPGSSGVPEMARVEIVTTDGLKLEAWYRKAEKGKQTILYLHGNAGHLGYRSFKIKDYLDAGLGVLLLGFRGYGNNPGNPTESNLYIDGKAALKFLSGKKIPLSKIVVYGESLGTGVAIEITRNLPVHSLILEAPFSSIAEIAAHHYFYLPTTLLLKDKYESIKKINEIVSPIYFVHGKQDRIIPWKFGKKLFEAAPDSKDLLLIPDAGHNNLYDFGVSRNIVEFIVGVE